MAQQGGGACGMEELPFVGEPGIEFLAAGVGQFAQQRRKTHQQLREVKLRIDIVPAAGRSEAGEDGRGAAATRVAYKQGILRLRTIPLHLPFHRSARS